MLRSEYVIPKKLVLKICTFSMVAFLQTGVALGGCAGCKCSDNQKSSPSQSDKQESAAEVSSNQWGVQAYIVDSGSTAVGLVSYSECHSAGVSISGFLKKSDKNSHVFAASLFGGPRTKIRENIYFAYGFDMGSRFGKQDGNSIKSSFFIAPYVSIEYQPLRQVVLSVWTNIYTYQNELIANKRTTTHKFGACGIGMSYLF